MVCSLPEDRGRRMRKFFGREQQLEKLDALWRKGTSSFVVIARRRRSIGKSIVDEVQGELDPAVEEDGFFDAIVPSERLLRIDGGNGI